MDLKPVLLCHIASQLWENWCKFTHKEYILIIQSKNRQDNGTKSTKIYKNALVFVNLQ